MLFCILIAILVIIIIAMIFTIYSINHGTLYNKMASKSYAEVAKHAGTPLVLYPGFAMWKDVKYKGIPMKRIAISDKYLMSKCADNDLHVDATLPISIASSLKLFAILSCSNAFVFDQDRRELSFTSVRIEHCIFALHFAILILLEKDEAVLEKYKSKKYKLEFQQELMKMLVMDDSELSKVGDMHSEELRKDYPKVLQNGSCTNSFEYDLAKVPFEVREGYQQIFHKPNFKPYEVGSVQSAYYVKTPVDEKYPIDLNFPMNYF